jgi:hypothetical protein
MTKYRGIRILPDKTKQMLRKRQKVDYQAEQEQFVDWLLDEGKKPDNEIGYNRSTVEDTLYKTNQFYRYVWTELEENIL